MILPTPMKSLFESVVVCGWGSEYLPKHATRGDHVLSKHSHYSSLTSTVLEDGDCACGTSQ